MIVYNYSFYLTIISFIYIIIVFISFSHKNVIKSIESSIYKNLLYVTMLTMLSEILLAFLYSNSLIPNPIESNVIIFQDIIMKTFLVGCAIWITIMFIYSLNLVYGSELLKKTKKYVIIFIALVSVLIIFAGVNYIYDENGFLMYSTGNAVNIAFGCGGILSFFQAFILLKNIKKIDKNKMIPIYVFWFLMAVVILIQKMNPNLLLINFTFGLTILLMYNTIENPDAKLVEYEKRERAKVLAAIEAKSEFLSSMSHELRTPLNAIIGLSEDIQSYKDEISFEIDEDTRDLIIASNNLLSIISNILDASKIESGKLDVVESDYNLKEELKQICKKFEIDTQKKKLNFNVEMSEYLPNVLYGDKLRIIQIINILLENAIDYTDVGKINFSTFWNNVNQNLCLIISDTGQGLSEENLKIITANKENLQVDKVYSISGSGLNLSIAKNLIKILGGSIMVETNHMAGTKFSISIPQQLGNEEKLKQLENTIEIDMNKLSLAGKRILVVDDNALNIKVLKKAIRPYGFEIDEAYNGKTAIEKIEINNNYDLVLMDISMPEMSGQEAIEILNKKDNFTTPVIALTADGSVNAKDKYVKMGFNDYLPKPFSRDMIAKKLYSIFKEE